jgi:hypothetical protein
MVNAHLWEGYPLLSAEKNIKIMVYTEIKVNFTLIKENSHA